MLVRLAILWRVVVNHDLNALDINSSCGDICCDKRDAIPLGEAVHRPVPLALSEATVERRHAEAAVLQLVTDSVDTHSCSTEDDAAPVLANRLGGYLGLHRVLHQPKEMGREKEKGGKKNR